MKKYFLGVACLIFISGMANAEDVVSSLQTLFLEQVKIQTPIYQKMLTCTPAKSEALEVFGIKNGKCHIFNQGVTCYLPLDVSKKFAQNALRSFDKIKNNTYSSEDPETQYMNSILNSSYCSY